MCIKRLMTLALCVALCSLPLTTAALESDADQPINISADRWDHRGAAGGKHATSVYTGHVVITQGSIRITAAQATVTLDKGKLKKALIVGKPATFHQDQENAAPIRGHAREIDYNTDTNSVKLIDNAKVRQGDELISANYIRYSIEREKVVAHRAKQEKGRVHVVIPPSDSSQ